MKRSFNGSLNFVHVGSYKVMEPSDNSIIEMRHKAEAHLRSKYEPGIYKDTTCKDILNFMYQFYESELDALLPNFATARWVGGIIFQYEQSGNISDSYKKCELSEEDSSYWMIHGPVLRQALDFLLEKLCVHGEIDKIDTPVQSQVPDYEKALICAQNCVEYSSVSNFTYMVVPEATTIKIYPKGSPIYIEHNIHPDIDRLIVEHLVQNNKEVSIRSEYMDQSSDPFDFRFHNQILNKPFQEKFGITYAEFQAVVTSLVVNSSEITDPGKAPMSLKEESLKGVAGYLGIPLTDVSAIMTLLILDKSYPRELWDSRQFNRINKRPFLEFQNRGRTVLMWSHKKIGDYLALLDSDLTFNKTPYGWNSDSLKSAIGEISNNTGKWFEKSVIAQLKKLGFVGREIKNKTFDKSPDINFDCGQIDYLGYHPEANCLAIFEFKMIETGFDARGIRQVKSYFLEGKKPYVPIFNKKIDWVNANLQFIKQYFKLEFNTTIPDELNDLKAAFVTYYPTLLSLFYTKVPCKSLIQFVDDCRAKGIWPYEPTADKVNS